METKPLTTIQAEARSAFPFMAGDVLDTERVKILGIFLDTQLSLAHAAGKAEGEVKGRNDAVDYIVANIAIDTTKDGETVRVADGWLLKAARLPHTEEKN